MAEKSILILCRRCNQEKSEDDFHSSSIRKKHWRCKQCLTELQRQRKQSISGLIRDIYSHQKHSKSKAVIEYSLEEFSRWLKRTKFVRLYRYWEASNHDSRFKPTVTRINSKKAFSFNNLQINTIMDVQKNKPQSKARPVIQMNKDEKVIAHFPNARVAAKIVGIKFYSNIHEACKGLKKSAGGFKWRYV